MNLDPLIVIASIFTYLIFYNGCLTFRLSAVQNIIAAAMVAFNILSVSRIMGILAVIPLMLMLILYAGWLQKQDFLLNALLILLSYMVVVAVRNTTHIVLKICGFEKTVFWIFYALIDYPIFYIASRFLAKKAVAVRGNMVWSAAPKTLAVIAADIILCVCIFMMNIKAIDQSESTAADLFLDIILYTAYFLLTFLMIAVIVKEFDINAKIMMKQHSYDNLKEYMDQIEELNQSLHTFRHDYVNVMMSMAGYIETEDLDGLRKYFEREVYPLGRQLYKENYAISCLHNLAVVELKSLISVKVNYAMELHVKVDIDISDKIDTISMKTIDLIRIIGILLDNAIEASQECSSPAISLGIVKSGRCIVFIVKNTYIKKQIDYSRLGSLGISSKGELRGNGLFIVKSMIERYNYVTLDTEYDDESFTQCLEICGEALEVVE